MIHRLPGAALTALCCLGWPACDAGPTPEESDIALSLAAASRSAIGEPSPAEPPPEEVIEQRAADEEPLATLATPLQAWPLSLSPAELSRVDDAVFAGDHLILAGRKGDDVVLLRLQRQVADDGAVAVRQGGDGDRLVIRSDGATTPRLIALDRAAAAMWISDGHLWGVAIEPTGALSSLQPSKLSGAEGGRLQPPLVIARAGSGVLACAVDELGPTCLALDAGLDLIGMQVIGRRFGRGTPQALFALDEGFALVLGGCRGSTCARIDLGAVILDGEGRPDRRRSLPLVQRDRGVAYMADGDELIVVARRVGAGEHSAWRAGRSRATRELAGFFSRVVGGFTDGTRTLLLERAHLTMRDGFPVRGYHVRPLVAETKRRRNRRARRDDIEREALPDRIAKTLPTDAEQSFSANGDALLFTAPTKRKVLRATVLRLVR